MTQHDLAAATGIPQSSIARIERGTVTPRMATLVAILEATGQQLVVEPRGPDVDLTSIRQRLALDVPQRTRKALPTASARDPRSGPLRVLRRLRRFGVPFVLIGDLAEVVHGVPAKLERVVEVCHPRTDEAVRRLDMALDDLGTDAGRLRLRTETDAGDGYDVLARTAVKMYVDAGLLVRVAAIEDLVRVRLANGAPENRQAAAVLRAIADERG